MLNSLFITVIRHVEAVTMKYIVFCEKFTVYVPSFVGSVGFCEIYLFKADY